MPVKIKDFRANCRTYGDRLTEAWANTRNSPIVVHRQIGTDGELYGDFILSHRVSGLTIRSWRYSYKKRSEALKAAARIERFPEWKRVGRAPGPELKPLGWSKRLEKTLGNKVGRALSPETPL